MFTEISIRNFKSLADVRVELGPLTVLVGRNGSGKSNFLQAIEFASWATKYGSIGDALQSRHLDLRDLVYMRQPKVPIEFSSVIEVPSVKGGAGTGFTAEVDLKIRRSGPGMPPILSEDVVEVRSQDANNQWMASIGDLDQVRAAREGVSELSYRNVALEHSLQRDVILSKSGEKKFPRLWQVAKHFSEYLHYEIWGPEHIQVPDSTAAAERQNGHGATWMGSHGERLPTVLARIQREKGAWSQLCNDLQSDYPQVRFVRAHRDRTTEGWKLTFAEGRSEQLARRFSPQHMSAGLLRVLALLAVKYDPQKPTVIGFEEPENGLHPSVLRNCLRRLQEISNQGTQVIVTTHSPYLLNLALESEDRPRAELKLVMRGESGRTTIESTDPEKIELARRHGFGIGELWGMLLDENELAK
ncbi:MAG: AAA family ATPase [Planctomycetales bacterium]